MATLLSPGISVTITDESQYVSSGQGTIPLIIMATATNKASPTAGGGVAPFTAPSQAGQLFLATSQQDLIQAFGNPVFQTALDGSVALGDETNEYGLWAAWSYLSVANQCYVIRADIDMNALQPNNSAPQGAPLPGTYWLNLSATKWGVFRANGNSLPGLAWTAVNVKIPAVGDINTDTHFPNNSWGSNGDVAVNPYLASNYLFERVAGTWYQLGSTDWKSAHQTVITGTATAPTLVVNNSLEINSVSIVLSGTTVSSLVTQINNAAITNITASQAQSGALTLTNTAGGSIVLANVSGTPLTTLGLTAGTYAGVSVTRNSSAQYPDGSVAGSFWVKGNPANNGAAWNIQFYNATLGWTVLSAPFFPFDSTLDDGDPDKDTAAVSALAGSSGSPAIGAVYVGYDTTTGDQQIRRWSVASNGASEFISESPVASFDGNSWSSLTYEASLSAPTTSPSAGTLWYSADLQADIMVCTGTTWVGYRNYNQGGVSLAATDPKGVQIAGSAPSTQSDGSDLVQNDLWIDGSDLENYPAIYRFDVPTQTWNLIDNTDNTTPFGIVFADARQDSGPVAPNGYSYANNASYSTSPSDLIVSDYVDPDAPNPETYPAGTLLFNTRFSTYNVKSWTPGWFRAGGFQTNTDFTTSTFDGQAGYNVGSNVFPNVSSPDRWVTVSGNDVTGTPWMGRKAQRVMVVKAMTAAVESNQQIRSEIVFFNLMAAPGYPELINPLNALNQSMNFVAFTVGDTPQRLPADATSVQNWATNAADVPSTNDDGLTDSGDYIGIYYPWGLGVNIDGSEVMVPASAVALVTIAYNDQVAYPWYPPAGFNRGLVTNASSVGYLNATSGAYVPVILNQGQRDTLYVNKINPIAYIPNRGLVVYGQKTLDPVSSALDRINVARLMNYITYNLDNILKPFLFELNTAQVRSSAAHVVTSFLNQLVSQNGLYDFAVVCDNTNNTPTTIDANELWVDVAVQPTKAIEFIYVPVRVLSTQSVA